MKTRTFERRPAPAAPTVPAAVQAPAPLENLLAGWNRFWFTPADPTGLGLMRLLGGLVILYVHLSYTFDLMSYVGPQRAWLDTEVVKYLRYEAPIYAFPNNWIDPPVPVFKGQFTWSVFFHLTDPFWIYTTHFCLLGIMALFTIGLWTRITSVLTYCCILSYIHRAPVLLFGMDTMMVILVFYLMIAPCGAALSVDRLLQIWRDRRLHGPNYVTPPPEPSILANFALRCMQIHFCVIYLASGTSKLLGSRWWNGTAIWYCYANYSFAPMNVGLYYEALVFLCHNRWLWELVMTGGVLFTLFVEIGLPFLVWLRSWRWFMVICSVLLHTGIGLFMSLITFSMFMLLLLMAFIPPEAIKLLLAELGEQGKRLRQGLLRKPARRERKPELVMSR